MSNFGVGVYFMSVIWFISLMLCWVSVRTGHFIGKVSVIISSALTIVLILLPKEEPESSPTAEFYDKTIVPRYVILSLLLISVVIGAVFLFIDTCLTPVETYKVKRSALRN